MNSTSITEALNRSLITNTTDTYITTKNKTSNFPSVFLENEPLLNAGTNFNRLNPVIGDSITNMILSVILLISIIYEKSCDLAMKKNIQKRENHEKRIRKKSVKNIKPKCNKPYAYTFTLEGLAFMFVAIVSILTIPVTLVLRVVYEKHLSMHPGFSSLSAGSCIHWLEVLTTTIFIVIGKAIAYLFEMDIEDDDVPLPSSKTKESVESDCKKEGFQTDDKTKAMDYSNWEYVTELGLGLPEKKVTENEKKIIIPPEKPQKFPSRTFQRVKKDPKEQKRRTDRKSECMTAISILIRREIPLTVYKFKKMLFVLIFTIISLSSTIGMLWKIWITQHWTLKKLIDCLEDSFVLPFIQSTGLHFFFILETFASCITFVESDKITLLKITVFKKTFYKLLAMILLIICLELECMKYGLKEIYEYFYIDPEPIIQIYLDNMALIYINLFKTASFFGLCFDSLGAMEIIIEKICLCVTWSRERSVAIAEKSTFVMKYTYTLFVFAVGITLITLYPVLAPDVMLFYLFRELLYFLKRFNNWDMRKVSYRRRTRLLKLFTIATSVPHIFYFFALALNYGIAPITIFSFGGIILIYYYQIAKNVDKCLDLTDSADKEIKLMVNVM